MLAAPPVELVSTSVVARTCDVRVVGDSLTVGAAPYLRRALKGRVDSVRIEAQVGAPFRASSTSELTHPAAEIWVVNLGTNDSPRDIPGRIKSLLRAADGEHKVVWTTIHRNASYRPVNRAVKRLARTHSNLFVFDWDAYVRDNPRALSSDGVHANARGYRMRGKLLADVILQAARTPLS